MHHRIVIVMAALLSTLVGCTSPYYSHRFECPSRSDQEIFDELSMLLKEAGMVPVVHPKDRYLFAFHTAGRSPDGKYNLRNCWAFRIVNDTIKAKAYQDQSPTSSEEKTQEISLNDHSAREKDKWYWTVRRGLAEWCGGTVQIEEQLFNPSPY